MLNSQAGIQLLEHRCVEYHLRCFPASTWLQPASPNHVDPWGDTKHPSGWPCTLLNTQLTGIAGSAESQIKISGSQAQESIQLAKCFLNLEYPCEKPSVRSLQDHEGPDPYKIMKDLRESCTRTPGKSQMSLITYMEPNASNSQGGLSQQVVLFGNSLFPQE